VGARAISLDDPAATEVASVGAKAAALARARRAGLPVLPGHVLPVVAGRAALRAGCAALARGGSGAARRAALATPVDEALSERLSALVDRLGGRVIVRSSSPLEADHRWSGAFSSLNEIGPADIAVAVRSCWASAFAVDPLERLERCGLDPERLGLAVLVQPEFVPDAGGTARVVGDDVHVTGVQGHPGALLSGWADGATATELGALVGESVVTRAARLATAVRDQIGDDTIEWAAAGGVVSLLQSSRAPSPVEIPAASRPDRTEGDIASLVLVKGRRVAGTMSVLGDAAGRLRYVRPHERAPGAGDILVCDRPLPAFAPLLFGAQAVVTLGGPDDSHLAAVARSLGVPMLVRAPVERVTGPAEEINAAGWLGVVDSARGELALLRPAAAQNYAAGGGIKKAPPSNDMIDQSISAEVQKSHPQWFADLPPIPAKCQS
jgi:phosphoenolpyruvate synthase/pyruvate phosphate dikinase